ncbi:MAG: iron-sulfur cluster assembly scaffold protein [Bryobacteraceae bacterium]|nr:iron-sulfur cluster assembly scaffold protein [Bryobacteraceae bacterium]
MQSPQVLDHFQNPRNIGELPAPAIRVDVANPACGDMLRLSVRWEGGLIAETAFQVRGCAVAIAVGSMLTELILGMNAHDLRRLQNSDIEQKLGGLRPESQHAAVLGIDAIKAVLKILK